MYTEELPEKYTNLTPAVSRSSFVLGTSLRTGTLDAAIPRKTFSRYNKKNVILYKRSK